MFGIMDRMRIPPRHRSAAFMNLAYNKLPVLTGTVDVDMAPLAMLTDENRQDDVTTALEDNDAAAVYVTIDLLQVYEVYQIVISSGLAGGYKSAASNTGVITLETSKDGSNWTERATQTTVATTYQTITLGYDGDGIPVSHVRMKMLSDGTRIQYLKPSEIEVFGC